MFSRKRYHVLICDTDDAYSINQIANVFFFNMIEYFNIQLLEIDQWKVQKLERCLV